MTVFTWMIACLVVQASICQKAPAKGNSAENQVKPPTIFRGQCNFPATHGVIGRKSVSYNRTKYLCLNCLTTTGSVRTLIQKGSFQNANKQTMCAPSGNVCNGMWCGLYNRTCLLAHNLANKDPGCIKSRDLAPFVNPDKNNARSRSTSTAKIPLVIGFTVGGILLAVVVAGIFLGRSHRAEVADTSEMMTTPMSLSNSEWMSSGGGDGSGNGRHVENMRVEEASREDLSTIPMYDFYGDKKSGSVANGHAVDYLLQTVTDDSSSMGQISYYGADSAMPQDYNTMTSSRSDDVVVLDDGYVTGGNFIGSPELMGPKNNPEKNEQDKLTGATTEQNGDVFWGGSDQDFHSSMTHESITLSLTHTPHYDGIEYMIQDQDLEAFENAGSYSHQQNKSTLGNLESLAEADEGTMRICFQYRDGDSDFDESDSARSRPVSLARSSVSSIPEENSQEEELPRPAKADDRQSVQSPCSEGEIEVSCNSKDSCEIRVVSSVKGKTSSGNVEISCHARSWNENGKGSKKTSVEFETKHSRPPSNKNFFGKENRSRSCTWKSPAAPTHSSSRKFSAALHCPASAPAHTRPRPANLTHVFVDVHRNMVSSDEDLLAFTPSTDAFKPRGRRREMSKSSFSSSDGDSMGDIATATSALPRAEPATFSTSSMPRTHSSPSEKTGPQMRNKSMYSQRYGPYARTPEWKPRTVRFSSSGSGEYAIPFGSLVP